MKTEMHPEIRGFFPETDDCFQYFDVEDLSSGQRALDELENFIAAEGPFDGVIGFSQGASLAATLMVQRSRKDPVGEAAHPVFKCAIFLGASLPCDPVLLKSGHLRFLSSEVDGEVIRVPTTHIWGHHDTSFHPPLLAQLCNSTQRQIYVHAGGHGIPGAQMTEDLRECVRVMKRSIYLAS
jgi:hypothetical protein